MTRRAEDLWDLMAERLPLVAWSCPLCDHHTRANHLHLTQGIVRHAVTEHPAYLPERQTVVDMLDRLPSLMRESVITVSAPNPDGPRVGRGGSSPAPPREVRLLRMANPGSESSLMQDLVTCSRLIWEAFDSFARAEHPQPVGDLSWSAELAWLRGAWPDAQAYLDPVDFAWIESEVRHITGTFASFAKVRSRPRYVCPIAGCRESMHIGEDDWLTCGAGHQHPGPKRLERQWRRKPPMSSRDLCEALRIPRGTLRRWHFEGRIKPTRQDGQAHYWLPWDAIALRYPDVVADIDARDAA